jgi:hypothetical protein
MYDSPPSDELFVELNEYGPYDGTDSIHHPCLPILVDTEHTASIYSDQLPDFNSDQVVYAGDAVLEDAINQQVVLFCRALRNMARCLVQCASPS